MISHVSSWRRTDLECVFKLNYVFVYRIVKVVDNEFKLLLLRQLKRQDAKWITNQGSIPFKPWAQPMPWGCVVVAVLSRFRSLFAPCRP